MIPLFLEWARRIGIRPVKGSDSGTDSSPGTLTPLYWNQKRNQNWNRQFLKNCVVLVPELIPAPES